MVIIDIRISKDINQKLELEKTFNKSTKSTKPDKVKDPSPKTIKRNISRDNFMKFQWPWII